MVISAVICSCIYIFYSPITAANTKATKQKAEHVQITTIDVPHSLENSQNPTDPLHLSLQLCLRTSRCTFTLNFIFERSQFKWLSTNFIKTDVHTQC